jgi:hypothetical protein
VEVRILLPESYQAVATFVTAEHPLVYIDLRRDLRGGPLGIPAERQARERRRAASSGVRSFLNCSHFGAEVAYGLFAYRVQNGRHSLDLIQRARPLRSIPRREKALSEQAIELRVIGW